MRVRKISAQCVLQFTPSLAAGCVLHRPASRVIHCSESFFFRSNDRRTATNRVLPTVLSLGEVARETECGLREVGPHGNCAIPRPAPLGVFPGPFFGELSRGGAALSSSREASHRSIFAPALMIRLPPSPGTALSLTFECLRGPVKRPRNNDFT